MREHDFTLILTADPGDDEVDRLYGVLDDGTLATVSGVPQIQFHRLAVSLEEAIRSAIASVAAAGLAVARVEIEPTSLAQTA